jgi:hypothetical protein
MPVVAEDQTLHPPDQSLESIQVRPGRRKETVTEPLTATFTFRRRPVHRCPYSTITSYWPDDG